MFDRLVSHGKTRLRLGPGAFCVVALLRRYPRGLRHRIRQSHLHLFLCEAQLLLRSRDGAPILTHRLQLIPVDKPTGIYRHARSRFVHHGNDFSKGFPVAHKPARVIVASRIVLGNEDVPSLRELLQGRGVAIIGFLIDPERQALAVLLAGNSLPTIDLRRFERSPTR